MKYNEFDLGQVKRGQSVEVKITGTKANVRLLDTANLAAFKAGRQANGYGGNVTTTAPVRLTIPRDGHWTVVVDYGGCTGSGTASVNLVG
ncbi:MULTISPECIES: DUF1883 domain-containing protein [unclassified Rathayibacter]|uniref:DUF1883 domain-containing protein n=1 Tax=unclassified Rathayibacter TaxID=2609250 RepID=UPI001889F5FF|nr:MULTISPECIES: DUF1883 domain-containing protein [unclassified Rathayibacter]MBF4462083.1 DUF1883 domain-containing protein [Rathayibacter sp. VKM Ac-2879]MBF4503874.1 DUF1883 domain-containing protein [Rathayibacter sp. VKM Ac-2878]